MGRPNPAGSEDIGVARPQRIECIDARSLLIAETPHTSQRKGKSCPTAHRTRTSAIVAEYLTAVGIDWWGSSGCSLRRRSRRHGRLDLAPKESPPYCSYGGPDESQTRTKAPQLSRGSADRAIGFGGFPNVVLGGRTPGAAARASSRSAVSA